ncbi:hypothetical protein SRRS_18790 [Sporomusa rhizae]|uniref:hypothetical protein n=1 Tax=Sporomusa rhizae TaxID=357999 RepID=UPI00352BC953
MAKITKCMSCGTVFDAEKAVLKPIGDGGYLECCPKCGSTNVYFSDYLPSEDDY